MQETDDFTLDYLDSQLRNLSKFAIDVDRESQVILGIIAKSGPVSETKIATLGKRRTMLSRDIVRYRILKTDLSTDFLSVKKGKKIGNLSKQEKLYSLTFKGLLASLVETPLQENFWIKKHISIIEKLTNKQTSEYFLEHIYYHILAFLILHANKKGILTNYPEPETDFEDNYELGGPEHFTSLFGREKIKGISLEYHELFMHSIERFYVSCEVVCHLVKNSLKITDRYKMKKGDHGEYNRIIDNLFQNWMWSIFSEVDETSGTILDSDEEDDDEIDDSIDVYSYFGDEIFDHFSFMASDEIDSIMTTFDTDTNCIIDKDAHDSLIH